MATSNVQVRVDATQAVSALRGVNQAAGQASAATQQLQTAAAGATTALGRTGSAATQAANNYRSLARSVSDLVLAYASLRTAQQFVQAGIQREESSRRLTFLAQGYGEVASAQEAAARTGRQFGLSITESNQQFAQLYGRLRPLGVSLQDIESAFVGFNTSAKVSGATAAESAGALLQLTQALGSGVLRGQELNSVLEQAPGLVVALTQELGAPISQIRKLAEEGKITSDVVIRALKRAGSEGADELAEAMKGPAQQVKNLQNAFQDLQVAATEDLLPAIISSIQNLKDVLISIGPIIRGIGSIAASTLGSIADLVNAATKPGAYAARVSIKGGRLPLGTGGAAELFKGTSGAGGVGLTGIVNEARELSKLRRQPYNQVLQQLMQNRLERMESGSAAPAMTSATPALLGGGAGGGGKGKGGRKGADKAARDAERAAKAAAEELARVNGVVRERKAETEVMMLREGMADRISAAEAAGDRALQIRLQGEQRALDIQYKYAQELSKENDTRAQRAIIDQGIAELYINQNQTQRELAEFQRQADQDRLNALQKAIELQYEQNTAVQQQKQLADGVASTIGQGMTSAFDALINGAQSWEKSLQQIASGVLVDIANQLIRIYVIEQAINAIKNFLTPFSASTPIGAGGGMVGKFGTLGPNYGIPQRAMGGSVTGGQPYLVGEKGPELFMPGRSGGIAPTGSFGGGVNVVVNVDASGTSVQGNEPDAAQLGRAVSVAVQAEIIKQQRPGGLLSTTRR